MSQKSQWSQAVVVLAVGAALISAAPPAQAQQRIKLTAPVTGQLPTGIQSGIRQPTSSPSVAPVAGPPVPAPAPVVTSPSPVVAPAPSVGTASPAPAAIQPSSTSTLRSTPTLLQRASPTPAAGPTYQSAPQGFSAGPTLLGQPRIRLGYMVNRIPPDFDGDGYIEHRKLPMRR